jgi:hypothetical protein
MLVRDPPQGRFAVDGQFDQHHRWLQRIEGAHHRSGGTRAVMANAQQLNDRLIDTLNDTLNDRLNDTLNDRLNDRLGHQRVRHAS